MRNTSKPLYIAAGFITLVIFGLGILLGLFIENERISYIKSRDREQKINFDSLQLQYIYLTSLKNRTACAAFQATLANYIRSTETTRLRLEEYVEKKMAPPGLVTRMDSKIKSRWGTWNAEIPF